MRTQKWTAWKYTVLQCSGSGATRTNGSGNGSAAAGMKAGNRQWNRTHREKEKFIQEAARKRTEKKEAEEQLLDLKA